MTLCLCFSTERSGEVGFSKTVVAERVTVARSLDFLLGHWCMDRSGEGARDSKRLAMNGTAFLIWEAIWPRLTVVSAGAAFLSPAGDI